MQVYVEINFWVVSIPKLAKMHIHKVIPVFKRSPIWIVSSARILTAAAAAVCLGRRFWSRYMLLQSHETVPFRWWICSMVDAWCINMVSTLFTLNHFFRWILFPITTDYYNEFNISALNLVEFVVRRANIAINSRHVCYLSKHPKF